LAAEEEKHANQAAPDECRPGPLLAVPDTECKADRECDDGDGNERPGVDGRVRENVRCDRCHSNRSNNAHDACGHPGTD
jgi:hypothetical protein